MNKIMKVLKSGGENANGQVSFSVVGFYDDGINERYSKEDAEINKRIADFINIENMYATDACSGVAYYNETGFIFDSMDDANKALQMLVDEIAKHLGDGRKIVGYFMNDLKADEVPFYLD